MRPEQRTSGPAPDAGGLGRRRPRRAFRRVARYLFLVVLAAIVLFPIYMTVVNALLSPGAISERPPLLFPTHPDWGTFATAFSAGQLGIYLRNSAIVSGATTLGAIATSLLAGYAFAFMRFPLKRVVFAMCLATLMVPLEVTIIPNHATIVSLGWFNTFPALIVPFLASGIGIFLFRQAFRGLPPELRDAARLDGYGHFAFLSRVVVPLTKPMVGAFAIFTFLGSWNQYLWPLIVTDTNSVRTVQIGLRQLEQLNINQIDVIFAGTVLAALPIFAVLVVFQRQLVRGLTQGAVKG